VTRHTVRCALVAAIAALLGAPEAARGDVGRRLFRGITYAFSPSIGTLQNGPQADQNIFRQHFIRNIAGKGWGYEFTRTFGTDSFGNPQQIDIGPLNGSLAGVMHNRVLVNRRIIPEINIQSDTANAPLNYNFSFFTGAQNFRLQGQFTGTLATTLNIFGFYTLNLVGNNTGTRTADGMLITDQQSTDFDLGPISVVGNVWLDAFAGALQFLGDTAHAIGANVPSAAAAAKTRNDEPGAAAGGLSDAQVRQLLGQALGRAFAGQVLGSSLFVPDTAADASAADSSSDAPAASAVPETLGAAVTVPEPGTLALLGAPVLLLLARRRSMSRRPGRTQALVR